jgi:hypothetical protein
MEDILVYSYDGTGNEMMVTTWEHGENCRTKIR